MLKKFHVSGLAGFKLFDGDNGGGAGGRSERDPIPYARFKEVNDLNTKLKTDIETAIREKGGLQTQLETLGNKSAADLQAATQRAENAEKNLTDTQLEALRLRVAVEKFGAVGLSVEDRLKGVTREELIADADRLLPVLDLKKSPGVPPGAGGSPTEPVDLSTKTPAEIRELRKKGKTVV